MGRSKRWDVVETYAGDGAGRQWNLEGVPIKVADEATGATIKSMEVLVIPKCGGDVGDDEAESGPEENDGKTMNALGKEEVDKKTEP